MDKKLISTTETAELLGISRTAVLKRINKGDLKAKKIGRNFVIERNEIHFSKDDATDEEIELIVKKVVKEYGETLRLLGKD